ncbi:MAG TPA: S41 family peptidase [Anaerolineales bacterium]|nr:S41 family peptidase [Anaerolineales bacterium]
MKIKRLAFGLSILSLLACNFVTQMVLPPTATPLPTITQTVTASPVPTATPLVPAYAPPECAAVPLATVPPDMAVPATPDIEIKDVSTNEQLRILSDLSDVVEEIYVYPDYNGKDWNEIQARYRARIDAGLDTQSFYREMANMIEELGDEHSFFLSPLEVAESQAELRGDVEFVGVGIYGSRDDERDRIIVISTFPGSPAEQAGIRHHDSILRVDGSPVEDDTMSRMRGPSCSAVVLTIQSPGEAPRDVMLVRYAIQGNVPIEARFVPTADGSKIGYIFIPSFFDETLPGQIENALNQFGPLDGLILDVRMNGGGSSSVAFPILEFFVNGRLGEFVSRHDVRPLELNAHEVQNSQTVPLIVMVSEDTVSFGEIFAGVLRDTGRARIVGETSLGNVEVLHGYDFEDGSQIWLAAETFDSTFSDTNWEETGIVPDVQAFAEWDTFYFETDPSVAAAINLLGHQ